MGDVMLFGILRAPYHLAMNNDTACIQYWQAGQRAADEIERLQEVNETIVVLNEQANNEVYWLEQEIERLREALQKISDKHCVECFKDACDALQQKESE